MIIRRYPKIATAWFVAFFLSGMVQAQDSVPAPVVDLTDPDSRSGIEQGTEDVRDRIESIQSRLEVIERIVQSRTQSQIGLQTQLDNLQLEVDTMRGNLEVQTRELQKVLERQKQLFLQLDDSLAAVSSNEATEADEERVNSQSPTSAVATNKVEITGGAETPQAVGEITRTDTEAYNQAVNLILKERQYEQAIPAFERFLITYPDSSLRPNAHYWLGQLLFNQKEWQAAISQFESVVNNYPISNKRADSIYKLGLALSALGNLPAAQQRFEQVVNEYPDSTSATLARRELE